MDRDNELDTAGLEEADTDTGVLDDASDDDIVVCINKACSMYGRELVNEGWDSCEECKQALFTQEDINEMSKQSVNGFTSDLDDFDGFDEREPSHVAGSFDIFDNGTGTASAKTETAIFTCEADLTSCPVALQALVLIPLQLYQNWVYLAGRFNTEWLAYLTGEKSVENGREVYRIEDMYFPPQDTTPAHVDVLQGALRPGTIAAVHSHVGMPAFFSPEDWEHMNHPVELVVNRDGDMKASGRTRLDCGRYHRGDAECRFTGCDEEEALVASLKAAIVPPKPKPKPQVQPAPKPRHRGHGAGQNNTADRR